MGMRENDDIPWSGSRPQKMEVNSIPTQPTVVDGNCMIVDGERLEIPIGGFPPLRNSLGIDIPD